MATEFNYRRAWQELALPAFRQAVQVPQFRRAWLDMRRLSPQVRQTHHSTNRLRWSEEAPQCKGDKVLTPPESFVALFSALGAKKSVALSHLVYYFGHWATKPICEKTAGATWKFRIWLQQVCIDNNALIPETFDTKRFMEHKEGTSYDNDEIVARLNVWLEGKPAKVERVGGVNFKVAGLGKREGNHPFMITEKHMAGSRGMLDPAVAPCGICQQPYSAHSHETAAFVDCEQIKEEQELRSILKALLEQLSEFNRVSPDKMKVDGFALVNWKR